MTPRLLAATVVLAAAAAGSAADRLPARTVPRSGEYFVLAGDFHVHAFPGDGSLAAWALGREAARAGLDVYAVTNHNQTIAAAISRRVSGAIGMPIAIVGQEVTNPDFHLIAVGIRGTIDHDQPAAAAIRDIHAQGGAAIAAHPGRDYARGWTGEAVALLDGSELAHPAMHESDEDRVDFEAFFRRGRTLNGDLAPIGSSDFHATPQLARCRTYLLAREVSEAGVIEAIRHGRTVAVDRDGGLHGDPALVARLRDAQPAARADRAPVLRRVSGAVAWLGVLAVVVLRGRPR